MSRTVCLYHNADLDGKCSAAIVYLAHASDVELVGVNYGYAVPVDSIRGRDVVIVDFSWPVGDMLQIRDKTNTLTWIDHHMTAIDAAKSQYCLSGLQIVGEAACELTWRFYYPGRPIPVAVTLLGRYDIWDEKNVVYDWEDMILPFQFGMRNVEHEPTDTLWRDLLFSDKSLELVPRLITQGKALLSYQRRQDEMYTKSRAFETLLICPLGVAHAPLRVIACNLGLTNSQLFKSVYDPDRHDAMLAFSWAKTHWSLSLYSDKPDIDCGQIAKWFGGGGHKGAAGFQCDGLPFKLPGWP